MPTSSALRRSLFVTLALAVGGVGAVLAGELVVRASGERPWSEWPLEPGEQGVFAPDSVLGWRARPGRIDFPVRGGTVRVTRLEDGSRATGSGPADPGSRMAVIGGSFAEGWGLPDEETLPWKLQAALPEVEVRNHAVGGYGTYQSLLRLEQLFAAADPPDRVVYGFTELHEERNVANPRWLRDLAQVARRGHVAVPYATLGPAGRLERHPPESHPLWPLRSRLALVNVVQSAWLQHRGRGRLEQRHEVTRRLLFAMDQLCRTHGARLLVAVLWAPQTADFYVQSLRQRGIPVVDCNLAQRPRLIIEGDGHPNGQATSELARCILEALGASTSGEPGERANGGAASP